MEGMNCKPKARSTKGLAISNRLSWHLSM